MPNPPLEEPVQVTFSNVPLGVAATASAGRLLQFAGNLSARIDGDASGVFTVSGLETMTLTRDASDGPAVSLEWVTVNTVDGAGPVDMRGARALLVSVICFCPLTFTETALTATVTVTGEGAPAPLLQIPITATISVAGFISIVTAASSAWDGVVPGTTADFAFVVESTMQIPIDGFITFNTTPDSPFSAFGVPVTVPAFGRAPVTIPLTCAANAKPGFYLDQEFDFSSLERPANSRILVRLNVFAPHVVIVRADVGDALSLAPGFPTACTITALESGDPSSGVNPVPIVFTPAVAPDGLSISIGSLTEDVIPDGTLFAALAVTISVKPGTTPGRLEPWNIAWSVAAEGVYPAQSGVLSITVTALPPEEKVLNGQVLTPSGTALGGFVSVTLRSDGDYIFSTNMHDSGFDDYGFQVRAVVTTPAGHSLVFQHSGNVSGTLDGGSRDDIHSENGHQDWINQNWSDARAATLSLSKTYHDSGLIGFAEGAFEAFVTFLGSEVIAGPFLGLVFMLGSELTQVLGTAVVGPGALPGVVVAAGAAWLLGPGTIFPVVAGVVAGAVADALINHRKMTGDEMTFADTVFKGTVPYRKIWLTDLSRDEGRKYTWPAPDGSILVNLGDHYSDPTTHADATGYYTHPGQAFIHELTHAWQIVNASFSIGLLCERTHDPSYDYGPPGPDFTLFTIEGQAQVVDDWYAGNRAAAPGIPPGTGTEKDPADPYYPYILNYIQSGEFITRPLG
jgi:hypothetical protein